MKRNPMTLVIVSCLLLVGCATQERDFSLDNGASTEAGFSNSSSGFERYIESSGGSMITALPADDDEEGQQTGIRGTAALEVCPTGVHATGAFSRWQIPSSTEGYNYQSWTVVLPQSKDIYADTYEVYDASSSKPVAKYPGMFIYGGGSGKGAGQTFDVTMYFDYKDSVKQWKPYIQVAGVEVNTYDTEVINGETNYIFYHVKDDGDTRVIVETYPVGKDMYKAVYTLENSKGDAVMWEAKKKVTHTKTVVENGVEKKVTDYEFEHVIEKDSYIFERTFKVSGTAIDAREPNINKGQPLKFATSIAYNTPAKVVEDMRREVVKDKNLINGQTISEKYGIAYDDKEEDNIRHARNKIFANKINEVFSKRESARDQHEERLVKFVKKQKERLMQDWMQDRTERMKGVIWKEMNIGIFREFRNGKPHLIKKLPKEEWMKIFGKPDKNGKLNESFNCDAGPVKAEKAGKDYKVDIEFKGKKTGTLKLDGPHEMAGNVGETLNIPYVLQHVEGDHTESKGGISAASLLSLVIGFQAGNSDLPATPATGNLQLGESKQVTAQFKCDSEGLFEKVFTATGGGETIQIPIKINCKDEVYQVPIGRFEAQNDCWSWWADCRNKTYAYDGHLISENNGSMMGNGWMLSSLTNEAASYWIKDHPEYADLWNGYYPTSNRTDGYPVMKAEFFMNIKRSWMLGKNLKADPSWEIKSQ